MCIPATPASLRIITERAGLGRATFFRHYRSKEDVIFPDHDLLLGLIKDRLATSSHRTALAAVSDAVRLVLLHYLDEGDLARRRYALTSTVAALRDREIASVARSQRLFREFISDWIEDPTESASLRAELMAASVVAAHNHVLRRWLRAEAPDPITELDEAMSQVIDVFTVPAASAVPAASPGPPCRPRPRSLRPPPGPAPLSSRSAPARTLTRCCLPSGT
jgi:AcrR family transcriptional regulator